MTEAQKIDIRLCIAYHEANGWDWSVVVEFLIRKAHGTLPDQEAWRNRVVENEGRRQKRKPR